MSSEVRTAYAPLLRKIHWATVVLFIAAMLIGLYCGLQPPGTSPRRELLEVHKSLGMTLLFLSILRLMVRFATKVPPEPSSSPHGSITTCSTSSCSRCRSPATRSPRPAATR